MHNLTRGLVPVNFKYDKTLLAPPGCKVVIHDLPEKHALFAYHGMIRFYIGPTMDHYRCYQVYVPESNVVQILATVDFFQKHVQMPQTSTEDRLAATLKDLSAVLKNPISNQNNSKEEIWKRNPQRRNHQVQ